MSSFKLFHLPAAVIELIAIFSIDKFHCEKNSCGLRSVCKTFREDYLHFYEFWQYYANMLVRQHDQMANHSKFRNLYRKFFHQIILPVFDPSIHTLKEIELPYCRNCQMELLEFFALFPAHFQGLRQLGYIIVDTMSIHSSSFVSSLQKLLRHASHLHLFLCGSKLSPEIEEFCVYLMGMGPGRIHCGSLLFNALKNRWTEIERGRKPSLLWNCLSKKGERIRVFEPHIFQTLGVEFEDYSIALSQIQKVCPIVLQHLHVPLEFYFRSMLFLLRNEALWLPYDSTHSIFPFSEIFQCIFQDRRWQIKTLWTIFKGFSFTYHECNLTSCLEPIFTIVLSLIHKYFDPKISFYGFFEKAFLHNRICLSCNTWLQRNTYMLYKAEMCLMCIVRRYLTFTNWPQLDLFFQSHGFPENHLYMTLQSLTESKRFVDRLVDVLWHCIQQNNIKGLIDLASSCKMFHIEPASLLFISPRHPSSDNDTSQMHFLSQCSAGCFAVFVDKFDLADEDVLQCITDLSEFQTQQKAPTTVPSFSSRPSDLYDTSYMHHEVVRKYAQFPNHLIFERELIAIPF